MKTSCDDKWFLNRKVGISMISVTSTLIVHRPERVLYYLPEINDEVKQYIADVACPTSLKEYHHAFGTYDEIGIFYLPSYLQNEIGEKRILGIECRFENGVAIESNALSKIMLPACDIIIQDIACDEDLSEETISRIISYAQNQKNERSERYKYIDDGVVSVFSSKEKLRIMYEIELMDMPDCPLSINYEDYSKDDLFQRAFREPITGYYNWSWMWDCLASYHLCGIKDYGFVHFDIKDFKMINELYSHQVGNGVLKRVTENIELHKDWIYFGARCDNDNFAMMIKDMQEEETRAKLVEFFDEISALDINPTYQIFYRCGVVNMRNAMNAGDTVADCAKMAQAMGTGINVTEINFYTDEMHEKVLWGKYLKAYLDVAIQSNEFLVYLQPKMDIYSENICGAEALIRWDYKHKGLMAPYRFIPYFEVDETIIKIDELVLKNVCSKLDEWKKQGFDLYPISVNLSRKHMEQPMLVSRLKEIVDSYGVDYSLIEFELTESATCDNQEYMLSVLRDLKKEGFLISMDDFGTGYSSLSLINEMPLDTLKIDKSFVDMIKLDEKPNKIQIILRHIISMAKEMGIHCIAEGAEEYEQILALRDLGCETVQGYYYSKPISMESFEEKYLQRNLKD